jgi:hypothetical protein
MKAKASILTIVVALLINCAGLYNASAFYDPGAERWLNRDPLGEQGFEAIRTPIVIQIRPLFKPSEFFKGPNTCDFVDNDSIDKRDPWGLFSTFYKCPNSVLLATGQGSIYTCAITASSSSIGAGTLWLISCMDPQLLKCVAQGVGIMNIGCAISDYSTFSYGCQFAAKCLMTGGKSGVPIPP